MAKPTIPQLRIMVGKALGTLSMRERSLENSDHPQIRETHARVMGQVDALEAVYNAIIGNPAELNIWVNNEEEKT